jgi:PAS domain S-box-containing protein
MAHQLKDPQIDVFDFETSLPMFQRFIEFVPDGVIGVRETGLIAFANVNAEEIFGYERGALLGRPMEILVPERFRDAHALHTAEYFNEPRMRPMGAGPELYGLRSDGSEFRVEISLSTIQSGRGMFALSVIRDVSEQNDAKRALPQSIPEPAPGPAPDTNDLTDPVAQILKETDFLASRLTNRPDLHESIDRLRDAATQTADLADNLTGRNVPAAD